MMRRALGSLLAAACLVAGVAVGGPPAYAATTQPTFLTFYGHWDNTPPGGDIAFPQIHNTAGGKGTFADPITFATDRAELAPGTKVWVPRVRKYFIMEDSCQECGEDWRGHGPNGGPGLRHIDLWIGGKGGSPFDAIDCEDALTHYNADGTPVLEPVVVNPASNETVDPTPLFNTGTGECYGGAQPNTTVGQYKNGSNNQCLDDPNNSTTPGVQLKTAACNGGESQRFTFHGAFLIIHDRCASMSGGKVVLNSCTGGPSQQWSINPNGTISDIQTGQKCVRASGGNVVAGSCSGAASQWAFTSSATNDFSVAVQPSAGSVTAGGSTTATVSTTVTAGSAQSVTLSASGLPAGASASFSPSSVQAGGSATVTFATTASTPAGRFPVTVTGTGASGAHSAMYTLEVTAPTADDFALALNPASGSVTAGEAATATVSTSVVSGAPPPVVLSATGAPDGVSARIDPAGVPAGGSATLTITTTAATAAGTFTITVTGTSGPATHTAAYRLSVVRPGGDPVLLSQGKPATASSLESSSFPAGAAFDGNLTGTRWASREGVDPQWLRVDLGATATVTRVKLSWEAAFARSYTIQVSPDGTTWTTIFTTTTGNGATDDLTGLAGSGRFVRMHGTVRGTSFGYSLFEMQVFGTVS